MKINSFRLCVALVAVFFLAPAVTRAVINAGLQPVDLCARFKSVVACEVASVDPEAHTFTMRITRAFKGVLKVDHVITMKAEGEILESVKAGAVKLPKVGESVVVFAGKKTRRGTKDFLLYYGMAFSLGRMAQDGPWVWHKGDTELVGTDGKKIPTLAGTWCGSTSQLIRLLDEIAAKRAHFPRKAYVQFKLDMLLDKTDEAPIRGVALYDIDNDGDLDVYACCDDGDRVYLQMKPLVFVNATDWMGLDCASPSCSFADVNGDGRADLLAGGELRLGIVHEGRPAFKLTELLPYEATSDLLASAFVELNGDGYPDVVASKKGGGLQAFLNPGAKGGGFKDVTKQMGLADAACGAEQTGFFAPGDWNDDGRTDLFYSAGKGYLLVQSAEGGFAPVAHDSPLRFGTASEEDTPTGAGCFADIMGTGRQDLIVPVRDGWRLIENRKQTPVDITDYGNEISEGSDRHVASAISDLNMDGHLDFYTTSAAPSGPNRYIINRGFGSFMLASVHKHYEHVFKGPALERGGWGVAAGDVNDDGYPDLLLGNLHGELYLVLNESASKRESKANPTDDEKKLLGVSILTVRILGKTGVLGARLTIEAQGGKVVARRDIGGNVVCGCRSPDTVDIALRESGQYTMKVRFADGHEKTQALDVSRPERQKITIARE